MDDQIQKRFAMDRVHTAMEAIVSHKDDILQAGAITNIATLGQNSTPQCFGSIAPHKDSGRNINRCNSRNKR